MSEPEARDALPAPIPPERERHWMESIGGETHHAWIGVRFEEIRLDYARARLPFRPEFLQGNGVVQGGLIASLLDITAVGAVVSALDERPARMATLSLQVQYLNAVPDGDLLAVARVRRRGRTIVFLEADAVDAAGKPVAHAELTYLASG